MTGERRTGAVLDRVAPLKPGSLREDRRRHPLLGVFGGWTGVLIVGGTLVATAALYLTRGLLAGLGHPGYLGVAAIAFLGNAPLVPVFPWMLLVVPMHGLYPTVGLVLVSAVGAALGEVFPYIIGANFHRGPSNHIWLARLVSLPRWGRYLAVFVISLSPAISFPGLAAGALRVPLWAMTAMKLATEGTKLWLLLEMADLARGLLLG